jgi:hypothetical protein
MGCIFVFYLAIRPFSLLISERALLSSPKRPYKTYFGESTAQCSRVNPAQLEVASGIRRGAISLPEHGTSLSLSHKQASKVTEKALSCIVVVRG